MNQILDRILTRTRRFHYSKTIKILFINYHTNKSLKITKFSKKDDKNKEENFCEQNNVWLLRDLQISTQFSNVSKKRSATGHYQIWFAAFVSLANLYMHDYWLKNNIKFTWQLLLSIIGSRSMFFFWSLLVWLPDSFTTGCPNHIHNYKNCWYVLLFCAGWPALVNTVLLFLNYFHQLSIT